MSYAFFFRCHIRFFFHVICVYFFMSCVFLCHMCNLCLRYQGGNAIDMSVNIKLTWNKYKMGMTWVLNDIKMCMTCNLSSDKRLEPPEPPYRSKEMWQSVNHSPWRSQAKLSLTLSPDQDWTLEKCYNADNKCLFALLQCTRRNQGDDNSRFWFLGSENVANMLVMSYFGFLSVNYHDSFHFFLSAFRE